MIDWNETFRTYAAAVADEAHIDPSALLDRELPTDRRHFEWTCRQDSKARYAIACGTKDVLDHWPENRRIGGGLIDTWSDPVVAEPRSPRVKGNFIERLESGRGTLARVGRRSGQREDVTLCDSFACGLAFCGDAAAMTISLPRWQWRHHRMVGVEGEVTELFDVAIISGG